MKRRKCDLPTVITAKLDESFTYEKVFRSRRVNEWWWDLNCECSPLPLLLSNSKSKKIFCVMKSHSILHIHNIYFEKEIDSIIYRSFTQSELLIFNHLIDQCADIHPSTARNCQKSNRSSNNNNSNSEFLLSISSVSLCFFLLFFFHQFHSIHKWFLFIALPMIYINVSLCDFYWSHYSRAAWSHMNSIIKL